MLVVDVVEVGVVTDASCLVGRVRLDGGAGRAGPQLVLLVGDDAVDFADAVKDPRLGGEKRAAVLLSCLELSGVEAEADQLAAEFVVVRSHGLLPGAIGVSDRYRAALFGLAGLVHLPPRRPS